MSWSADPRIEAPSVFVTDLPLCQVRLQDDARWPWLVLLPREADLREFDELSGVDRSRLWEEVASAMAAVRRLGAAQDRPVEKLNVGALGNVVAQLHLHVVGRRQDDDAWPGPVWGFGQPAPYAAERRPAYLELMRAALESPERR